MAVVLHHSKARGTNKLILLGIANHQGDGGAWPKVETLATYANVTYRNAQKAIEQLVRAGELARYVQQGGPRDMRDRDRPNRYDVLVTCPAWCDRTPNHKPLRGWQRADDGSYHRPDEQLVAWPAEPDQLEDQHQDQAPEQPAEPAEPERPSAGRKPTPATPPPAELLAEARRRLRGA